MGRGGWVTGGAGWWVVGFFQRCKRAGSSGEPRAQSRVGRLAVLYMVLGRPFSYRVLITTQVGGTAKKGSKGAFARGVHPGGLPGLGWLEVANLKGEAKELKILPIQGSSPLKLNTKRNMKQFLGLDSNFWTAPLFRWHGISANETLQNSCSILLLRRSVLF